LSKSYFGSSAVAPCRKIADRQLIVAQRPHAHISAPAAKPADDRTITAAAVVLTDLYRARVSRVRISSRCNTARCNTVTIRIRIGRGRSCTVRAAVWHSVGITLIVAAVIIIVADIRWVIRICNPKAVIEVAVHPVMDVVTMWALDQMMTDDRMAADDRATNNRTTDDRATDNRRSINGPRSINRRDVASVRWHSNQRNRERRRRQELLHV
jgi:hypothetical protein